MCRVQKARKRSFLAHVVWGCESERAPGSESWRLSAKHEATLQADSSLEPEP